MKTKVMNYLQTASTQMAGVVNRLNDILYAGLVTGFNSKNVSSIVVSGNIATVTTSTAHGYKVGDGIKIEGANESVFNDEFEITSVPTTTTFTFPLVTGLTSGTGTITVKIAPLGWERVYTGTNKSVYRSLDPSSTHLYLRIDDSPARTATVTMYETMSSVDVGTGATSVIYWSKSTTANTVTRQWYLVGNKKTFYLMSEINLSIPAALAVYYFGDYRSFRANDPWACAIGGHSTTDPPYSYFNNSMTYSSGTTTGLYLARGPSWLGGAVSFGFYGVSRSQGGFSFSPSGMFPSATDNSLHFAPIYVFDTAWRGLASGYFISLEQIPSGFAYPNKTKFIQDGKTFVLFRVTGSTTAGAWGNIAFSLYEGDWA